MKRTWRSRLYFYPKLIYSVTGVFVISFLVANYGGISMFSDNMNSIFGSTTNSAFNSQQSPITPAQDIAKTAIVQTHEANLVNSIGNEISKNIPSYQSFTSANESMKHISYVNSIRTSNGANPIKFDIRVYNIAMARVNDMDKYGYMDHTNPQTGTCADSMKTQYGLSNFEYVAENAFGFDSGGHYSSGLEKEAIDSWMTSRGHRYNLLYPHSAGAVACSNGGHCVFLGLNNNRFGEGCHTGAQGIAFWNSIGKQPREV